MAWMIKKSTGELVEMPDEDVRAALELDMVDFAEPKVPVRYYKTRPDGSRDPSDEWGEAKLYSREEAKLRLREDPDAHYMSPQQAYDWKVEKKYGTGYEGAAAALGAADMVTLNGASMIGEAMGYPTREIAQANPWWHVLGDIGSTVGALGLTAFSGGTAAPLTVPILSKEGAKWSAKFGAKNVHKLTAPYWITKAGAKAPGFIGAGVKKTAESLPGKWGEKVAASILRESGEQSLKRQAATGILARTASLGTESLLYSTGYAVNDNLLEYVNGDPEKAKENILYGIGAGTVLGLALPFVGSAALNLGLGAADYGRRKAVGAFNWIADRKATDNYLRDIAKESDELGVLHNVMKRETMEERLLEAKKGREAREAQQNLVGQYDEVAERTQAHFDDMLGINRQVREIEQAGHTMGSLKTALTEGVQPGTEGAASSGALASQLLGGLADEVGVNSGSLLDNLADQVDQMTGKAAMRLKKLASPQGQLGIFEEPSIQEGISPTVPFQIREELKYVHGKIAELKARTADWVTRQAKALLEQGDLGDWNGVLEGPDWRRRLYTAAEGLDSQMPGEALDAQRRVADVFAREPELVGVLDQDFNATIFGELERLAARLHTGIIQGRFQDVPQQQQFINTFKEAVTDFLTGRGIWEAGPNTYGGYFPWGNPALEKSLVARKRQINALFSLKDGDYKEVRSKFASKDPEATFARAPRYRASLQKIKDFIYGLNSGNKDDAIDHVTNYGIHHKQVLEYLKRNFNRPSGVDDSFFNDAANRAADSVDSWDELLRFLREDMEPALNYAEMLKKEHNQMNLSHFAKGMIPGPMAALAGIGAAVTGGPAAGAAVAFGPGVAKTRLAMTPMNTILRVQRMFEGIQTRDEAVKNWISSYIKNYGKFDYDHKGISKWPRMMTSNLVARYTRKPGDYRHKVGGDPSNVYGIKELKNTREALETISKSPGLKEALFDRVTAEVEAYAPEVAPLIRDKMEEYLTFIAKMMPETIKGDFFSEDIWPSDLEVQKFAEILSVLEHGPFAVFRSLAEGVLSQAEWDTMEEFYPSTAFAMKQMILETVGEMGDEFKKKAPESFKEQLAIMTAFNRTSPQVEKRLRETFAPKEEGKPGPKPQAKWQGDTSQLAQLSGTRIIDSRRS